MPYRNRLRGLDVGGMTGDVSVGCDCSTDAPIIFKNSSSLAACLQLSFLKKSNISLAEVSKAIVLNVFTFSFISVKIYSQLVL